MGRHLSRYFFAATFAAGACLSGIATLAAEDAAKPPTYELPFSNPNQQLGDLQDLGFRSRGHGYAAPKKSADEYRRHGIEHYKQGHFQRAVADLTRALEINPPDDEALIYRSLALLNFGAVAKAMDDANTLIARSPNVANNYWLRGNVHRRGGEQEKAINDYSEAIRLEPRLVQAYRERGIAQFKTSHRQAALQDLGKAIQLDPKDSESYETRAFFHVISGDWAAALQDWNSVVELQPKSAFALAQRALIHGARGDHDKAEADYAAAVAIDPQEAGESFPQNLTEPAAETLEAQIPPIAPENILAEFDLEYSRDALILPLHIGDRALRFVLDTGCSITTFDRSLRSLLGGERGRISIGTHQGWTRIRLYDPPTILLGSLTIEPVTPVACVDLSTASAAFGEQIDGLLGIDFLSRFIVQVDVSGRKVVLLRSTEDILGPWLPLIQSDDPPGPYAKKHRLSLYRSVSVSAGLPDGRTVPFLIDTGAGDSSVALAPDHFKQLKEANLITPRMRTVSGTMSGIYAPPRGVLASLTVGDFHHQNLSVSTSELSGGGLLGINYLSRYVATFDFPQGRLFLNPSSNYAFSDAKLGLMSKRPTREHREFADESISSDAYDRQVGCNCTNPTALNSRGGYWLSQGKLKQAIADYTEAIRLDPDDSNGFFYRGCAREKQGNFAEAYRDFSRLIRIDTEWSEGYARRALAAGQLGSYHAAIDDLNKAIDLDPRTQYFCWRGWIWSEKAELERAIQDLSEAVRLDPKNTKAYLARGFIWRQKGSIDQALADFTEAIRLSPSDPSIRIYRGMIWVEEENKTKALEDFNAVIQANPGTAVEFVARGQIAELDGDDQLAMQNYAIAMDRGYEAFPPETRDRVLAWKEKNKSVEPTDAQPETNDKPSE